MLREEEEQAEAISVNEIFGSARPSCSFGHKCYRKSITHRSAMAHLGDEDFKINTQHLPPAKEDAPDCPYGLNCYRINPDHFKNYKHPSEIDVSENYKNHYLNRDCNRRRRNQRARVELNMEEFEDVEFSEEDPFEATDSDEDMYIPSDD